ncbi:hypothetical protein VPNG_03218 [Cytospora leucostoma]|uniref:Uncharacterized protein n=1 Tax=Cytospora leucostoma TaxID=1230097 RepID=A0A423XEV9_9PEZI|nr:hypothetical protein VPNG_03218 [Cytospora leucostoma]
MDHEPRGTPQRLWEFPIGDPPDAKPLREELPQPRLKDLWVPQLLCDHTHARAALGPARETSGATARPTRADTPQPSSRTVEAGERAPVRKKMFVSGEASHEANGGDTFHSTAVDSGSRP